MKIRNLKIIISGVSLSIFLSLCPLSLLAEEKYTFNDPQDLIAATERKGNDFYFRVNTKRVMNTESDDPVDGIILSGSGGGPQYEAEKTGKGEFFVKDLPPGDYNLSSSDQLGTKLVRKATDAELNDDAQLKEFLHHKYGVDFQK